MAKKSFKATIQEKAVNPTLQFISQPEQAPETLEEERPKKKTSAAPKATAQHKAPPARRAQPQYEEETKSRRLQLLLTPSLYEAIKGRAAEERMSVNELINSILRDAVEREG